MAPGTAHVDADSARKPDDGADDARIIFFENLMRFGARNGCKLKMVTASARR
jgi:hypothetical protein